MPFSSTQYLDNNCSRRSKCFFLYIYIRVCFFFKTSMFFFLKKSMCYPSRIRHQEFLTPATAPRPFHERHAGIQFTHASYSCHCSSSNYRDHRRNLTPATVPRPFRNRHHACSQTRHRHPPYGSRRRQRLMKFEFKLNFKIPGTVILRFFAGKSAYRTVFLLRAYIVNMHAH
jgi:hypothetical protein